MVAEGGLVSDCLGLLHAIILAVLSAFATFTLDLSIYVVVSKGS